MPMPVGPVMAPRRTVTCSSTEAAVVSGAAVVSTVVSTVVSGAVSGMVSGAEAVPQPANSPRARDSRHIQAIHFFIMFPLSGQGKYPPSLTF